MIWHDRLYKGMISDKGERRIRRWIDAGRYPAGIYLLALPKTGCSLLEILPAGQLGSDYVKGRLDRIVGLALGKEEAELLTRKLVQEAWEAQGNADLSLYLTGRTRG